MRSKKGLKRVVCFVVIAVATMSVFKAGYAEASRRMIDLDNAMETRMLSSRKVEISGKLFDVCINQAERTITVRGLVEDWDELDRVEDYFKNRGPSDYQVTCNLDFGY